MKNLLTPHKLRLLVPGCGLLGFVLRLVMVSAGTDGKGLITPGHPAWIALLVLTAAVALVLLAALGNIRGTAGHAGSFPISGFAAAGGVPAALGAVAAALRHFSAGPVITGGSLLLTQAAFFLYGALMALAAVSFLAAGWCRLTERKPFFLFHVVVCAWFALEMLNLYRTWSFDPQLQDYCFELFACIALALTAYELAAFGLDKGSHRKLWFWGLASVYLCCLCLTSGLFFPVCGVWALSALSAPRLRRERPRMEPEA